MSDSNWTKREPLSFNRYSVQLLSVENNEFLAIPETHINGTQKNADGIYKYNSFHDKWIKVMQFPETFKSTGHSATFDIENEMIYVCNEQSQIVEININRKTINILSKHNNFGILPAIIHCNDTLHIIIRDNGVQKHCIFDKDKKEFKEICSFHQRRICQSSQYIKLIKGFLMPSLTICGDNITSLVSEFSVLNNNWSDWDISIPNNVLYPTIIATKNHQYLIFIGGAIRTDSGLFKWTDCISVYNARNNKIIESNIKCPEKSCFTATITRNDDYDDILTFGFINQCFKSLPDDLVKLIGDWVCYETIHVIVRTGDSDGCHWMIDVDQIIQSVNQ